VDAKSTSPKIENRILTWLPKADRALADRLLEPVALPLRQRIEQRDRASPFVYFPETGLASVIVRGPKGHDIEAGVIGCDGMTGLAAVLGAGRPVHEVLIQLAGTAQRMPMAGFSQLLKESEAFDTACRRYVHAFMIQVSYTALANGRNNIEERLARWLLIAQDRAGGAELALTHEFLAVMLGVRRAGVTLAINLLARAGLVSLARGRITIADRKGLVLLTKGSYGPAEEHFEQLFSKKTAISAA
jgi:CRP-like cAMP-binding protein